MAARTALTPVQLVADGNVAAGSSGTVDAANGNTVAWNPSGSPAIWGPNRVLIVVTNGDSASHSITVRASGSGVTAAGATQVNPAPSNTVFTQATLGDLTVAVAASATQVIGPLTSDRFAQADGSMSLDWTASTSMSVWIYQLPTLKV
jgi:hypothetical protein